MAILNNRTSSELFHENAYTNNTFNLQSMEKVIRNTMENSFHYLMRVQQAYTEVERYALNESDVYINEDGKFCISVDKDFIDSTTRKVYRHSQYYNQFIDLSDISGNPSIFLYVPVILIDDKALFSYKVRSSLDGKTEIMFTHIRHLHEFTNDYHSISVTFYKNASLQSFVTNLNIVEKYDWNIPVSVTKLNELSNTTVFFFMRGTKELLGSNYFVATMDDKGNFGMCNTTAEYDYLLEHGDVEITVLQIPYLNQHMNFAQIRNRVDNNRQSAVVCLEEKEWVKYDMPIPTKNLIVLKCNKVTGERLYENNKDVILHYPNIYEIMSDDVDAEMFDYQVFYIYRPMYDHLSYPDFLHHTFRYFAMKLGLGHEEAIREMLYTKMDAPNEEIQNFFFEAFRYEDPEYVYGLSDFAGTTSPYDFDYKLEKFNDFVHKNPYILMGYAKDCNPPFTQYYLDVRTIDLDARIRFDTAQESSVASDMIQFTEPHYVFKFMNTSHSDLHLRFFIDGIFCNETEQIFTIDMDYIYIPTRLIQKDSRIDIERFESYKWQQTVTFKDTVNPVTFEFPAKSGIKPTLYDLFVVNKDGKKVDRTAFKIYALLNKDEYNISDEYGIDDESLRLLIGDNDITVDPDTGEVYITIEDDFLLEDEYDTEGELIFGDDDHIQRSYSDDRLPLKYMHLSKLKVYAADSTALNQELTFIVNKVPFLVNKKVAKRGLSKLKLYNGRIIWKEDHSYIRIFVNGRLVDVDYDIQSHSPTETFVSSRAFLENGDIISVDVTPYSYEQELHLDTIPSNFRIELSAELSKPFDLAYYDAYLNGKRLNETNIKMITPNIIQLYNVESRNNFIIYRKDRDYEFAGYQSVIQTPLDLLLTNEFVEEPLKKDIIVDILEETVPSEYIIDGTDTEPNVQVNLNEMPTNVFEQYRFFLDLLEKHPVVRPSELVLDSEELDIHYHAIYDRYVNDELNTAVFRPGIAAEAGDFALVFGRSHLDVEIKDVEEDVVALNAAIEKLKNSEVLETLPTGTLLGALANIVERVNGLTFLFEEDTGRLKVFASKE